MLAGQISDAMVRELNAIRRGPVTGKPLALAIQTGDNSDNAQYNEIRWNIDLLDRSEEHTSELQSRQYLVCRLLLEKKKTPPCTSQSNHHNAPLPPIAVDTHELP